jgi:hypothetical protein
MWFTWVGSFSMRKSLKHYARLDGAVKDEQSSLSGLLIYYKEKCFETLTPTLKFSHQTERKTTTLVPHTFFAYFHSSNMSHLSSGLD